MKRFIVATLTLILLTAVAVPVFAVPSDTDLKTAPGVEKFFNDIELNNK